MVNNTAFGMMELAKEDLRMADFNTLPNYRGFHAQQAAEKAIKAGIIGECNVFHAYMN